MKYTLEDLKLTKRLAAVHDARDDLLTYLRLTMPDREDAGDSDKSVYEVTPVSLLLAQLIQKMDRGQMKRACVSIGPQFGKSQIITRAGPAWLSGRDPYRNIMVGAYNQTFAQEFGGDVQALIDSSVHKQIFPKHELERSNTELLKTRQGGKIAFVGVGGSGTGKPADFFFVDDPFRNDEDAQSQAYRDKVWKWFTSVVFSRMLTNSRTLVVHTRWSLDDLIGRLADDDHPERGTGGLYAKIQNWEYINLPAVIDDPKLAKTLGLRLEPQKNPDVVSMFGSHPIVSLCETRKSLEFLAESKQLDERMFGALYMGKPTPDDGDYFKREELVEYDYGDLPASLRYYGASDHAASAAQKRDYTVLGCVGIDDKDDIWVLPDIIWKRMQTDKTVEEMIMMMRKYTPLIWWMENELISKSFGPFLKKRMIEERVYTYVEPVSVAKQDKELRSRAIQGRMQQKRVHFPRYAAWWDKAKSQLLKFPYGANDDFVDWLAHIGLGLMKEIKASTPAMSDVKSLRTGSIQWIMRNTKERVRNQARVNAAKGW